MQEVKDTDDKIRQAAVPTEIDYEALIKAAYARDKKWAQGTNGCIAFARGAEWYRSTIAAPQPVAQPGDDAAFLRAQIALALEEMSCANFNSAAERLRHCAGVTQAKPEQAAQQWQPIETAPKDSTLILLRGKENRHADGYWQPTTISTGAEHWVWPYINREPTHWMPLPAAPKPKE